MANTVKDAWHRDQMTYLEGKIVNNDEHVTTQEQSINQLVRDRRETGPNHPDWRQRLRRGSNATTYLYGERYDMPRERADARKHGELGVALQFERYRRVPGFFGYTPGPDHGNGSYYHYGEPVPLTYSNTPPSASVIQSANNEAMMRFREKARKIQNQFKGGVFLGELREVLHQIKNPAQAIRKGIPRYLKTAKKRSKGMKMQGAPIRDMLAETWFEYSFGVKPLLNDIDDAANALAQLRHTSSGGSRDQMCTGIGTAGETLYNTSSTYQVGYLTYDVTRQRNAAILWKYHGRIRSRPKRRDLLRRDLAGFDPREFLPTVWELLPYSWLIDYFTNIGDVINAWSFQNLDAAWINRTKVVSNTHSIIGWYPDWDRVALYQRVLPTRIGPVSASPQQGSKVFKQVERDTIASEDLIPTLEFQIPGMSTRWINLGALTHLKYQNRLRGLRRLRV